MSASVRRPRHYKSKMATASQSAAAVRELLASLRGKTKKRSEIASVLGCSPRTATRILRGDDVPYTARISLEWVRRICTYTQIPLEQVFGLNTRQMGQGLVSWIGEDFFPRALENASRLGVYVVARSHVGYGLSGAFSVEHHDGRVKKVSIGLRHPAASYVMSAADPPTHRLTVREQGDALWLEHMHPLKGKVSNLAMTEYNLKKTLENVFKFYNSIAQGLSRKRNARRRPNAG